MCVQETPGVSQPSALPHDSARLPKFSFNQKIFSHQRFQKYLTRCAISYKSNRKAGYSIHNEILNK